MKTYILLFFILIIGGIFFTLNKQGDFILPEGETQVLETDTNTVEGAEEKPLPTQIDSFMQTSTRIISETDGTKHSIPLGEILSGGPGKDGIPSIDNPAFISIDTADFLTDTSVGLGITYKGESRFYPYQILVWHEIVNDTIQGDPLLVTYCPLCATAVVFDPRVGGKTQSFGVSGRLWKSNLLMYNRTAHEEESLWSQVLGEAVVGPQTGAKLNIIPSDTVLFGEWKKAHPDTVVLSRETGAIRTYGRDPYGSYYTDDSVSFGATFNDDRLHPKAFVFGIEINGHYKAYHRDALKTGVTEDTFEGEKLTLTKDSLDGVRIQIGERKVPYISGFWFSWLAVHPDTELYK